MAPQKILVTYNFTSYDHKALDFVSRTFVNLKNVSRCKPCMDFF